ncbi:hypothetical protein T265_03002 [Opisthorchis viverrini]|uniref:Uncharacterized protein n=1 Tax=Opisthorchis viverrini TaxID=6198 RepID=A0A074ZTC7_OPIVI|nr:hypothetical protein T265_03002 [Opisthorchis viverrini]KER30653.1 hypothetical protein T265_03002 [Opisthorchis viverrini]
MPHEGGTRAEILLSCPRLDSGSRKAEVGFEPRTFRLCLAAMPPDGSTRARIPPGCLDRNSPDAGIGFELQFSRIVFPYSSVSFYTTPGNRAYRNPLTTSSLKSKDNRRLFVKFKQGYEPPTFHLRGQLGHRCQANDLYHPFSCSDVIIQRGSLILLIVVMQLCEPKVIRFLCTAPRQFLHSSSSDLTERMCDITV